MPQRSRRSQHFLGRHALGGYLLLTTVIALGLALYLGITLVLNLTGDEPPPALVVALRVSAIVVALGGAALSLYLRSNLAARDRR